LPLRHRVLGRLQRPIVLGLVRKLRPNLMHTQIQFHQKLLKRQFLESELLSLHGNIPVASARPEGRAWVEASLGGVGTEDLLSGFFGNLLPTLDLEQMLGFAHEVKRTKKRLRVLSAGKLSVEGVRIWKSLEAKCADVANFTLLGPLDTVDVSKYLAGLDIGLTTYPPILAGKSGAVAAMLEHGLCVRTLGNMHSLPQGNIGGVTLTPNDGRSVSRTAASLTEGLRLSGYFE
jgi:hypothetical protein